MADDKKFSWDDDKPSAPKTSGSGSGFSWSDEGPNVGSESEMAAHPPIPKATAKMEGASPVVAKLEDVATHQKLPTETEIRQGSVNAGKFGADILAGQIAGGPLARAAETHVIPALKAVPLVGKAVTAIDEAPSVLGKVARGATVGGVSGGVEGMVRGRGLAGSAADAGKGALVGGALGLALPAVSRLARIGAPTVEAPAVYPGASEPSYEGYAANRGGEIMDARRLQPLAFAPPAPEPAAVYPGASEPSYEGYARSRGAEINAIRSMQPQPERLPTISDRPFALTSPATGNEPAVQNPLTFPKAEPEPVSAVPARSVAGGRLVPIDRQPAQSSAVVSTGTNGRLAPIARPSLNAIVNQAAGVKPLQPNVPLREQVAAAPEAEAGTSAETDPIKLKYPDPAIRQMVRANGEDIVSKVGDDAKTMKAIHDLTRVELRQALINSGEDMGQVTVSNSKFAGEGSIGREEAFRRLLQKGVSPKAIIDLAKK